MPDSLIQSGILVAAFLALVQVIEAIEERRRRHREEIQMQQIASDWQKQQEESS